MSNPFGNVPNPRILAIRRLVAQLLGNKYGQYDEVLQRSMHHLVTEADLMSFAKMVGEVYEAGYLKAVGDYRTQLAKMGINVAINRQTLADSQINSQ